MLISTLASITTLTAYAESDLDNDGVNDEDDSCPNLQEDYEGAIDGCPSNFVPWYDKDFDGIEDHIDACPNFRETYNKFQDEDGCPDSVPGTSPGGAPDSDGDGFIDNVS